MRKKTERKGVYRRQSTRYVAYVCFTAARTKYLQRSITKQRISNDSGVLLRVVFHSSHLDELYRARGRELQMY